MYFRIEELDQSPVTNALRASLLIMLERISLDLFFELLHFLLVIKYILE